MYLYLFGMLFNILAMIYHDGPKSLLYTRYFDGYNLVVCVMIMNHALSGIAVSMVMKYADNIVKVYATSVSMVLTTFVSMLLFKFRISVSCRSFLVPQWCVLPCSCINRPHLSRGSLSLHTRRILRSCCCRLCRRGRARNTWSTALPTTGHL